jgi:hypothetical protein
MPKDTEIALASTGGGRIATMQRRIWRLTLSSKPATALQGFWIFRGYQRLK